MDILLYSLEAHGGHQIQVLTMQTWSWTFEKVKKKTKPGFSLLRAKITAANDGIYVRVIIFIT